MLYFRYDLLYVKYCCFPISILPLGAFYANFSEAVFRFLEWFIQVCASQPLVSYNGMNAIPFAVLMGTATIYCLYAQSLRHLTLRVIASLVVIVCSLIVLTSQPIVSTYNRKKYIAEIQEVRQNLIALTFRDKQQRSFPTNDGAMEKLALMLPADTLWIRTSGRTSRTVPNV